MTVQASHLKGMADHVLERRASIAPDVLRRRAAIPAQLQSAAELQLFYKLANARLRFPLSAHLYPGNFSARFLRRRCRQNMPDPAAMIPIEQARPVRGYKERFVLEMSERHLGTLPQEKQPFWQDFSGWLLAATS